MQYVETRVFYVKTGFFWAFSENGTSVTCFFKKSLEMFSQFFAIREHSKIMHGFQKKRIINPLNILLNNYLITT